MVVCTTPTRSTRVCISPHQQQQHGPSRLCATPAFQVRRAQPQCAARAPLPFLWRGACSASALLFYSGEVWGGVDTTETGPQRPGRALVLPSAPPPPRFPKFCERILCSIRPCLSSLFPTHV